MATTLPTDASLAALMVKCRLALATGCPIIGTDIIAVIDALETLTVGQDNKSVTAVAALEAVLVTQFAILVADAAAPTQAHVNAMVTACATPRTAALAASAANYADIATNDMADGRSV